MILVINKNINGINETIAKVIPSYEYLSDGRSFDTNFWMHVINSLWKEYNGDFRLFGKWLEDHKGWGLLNLDEEIVVQID